MSYIPDRRQHDGSPPASPSRPGAGTKLDGQLEAAARRVAIIRGWFYAVVLLVALGGQITGAMEALGLPWFFATPAVTALELGGVVVMANADVRRRLGERAIASRVLSAGIAGGAVAFNWLTHADKKAGAFFAGMSLLGYLVWMMHTENSRRDRLRATGDLPPVTPVYEVVGHWLRHPWVTRRALALAKASPGLGLYPSLQAARAQIRAERRHAALSTVLHRKIRKALDADTADIAVAVYDIDEIAHRLAEQADYDGLTALIAADLTPARVLAGNQLATGRRRRWWRRAAGPDPEALASAQRLIAEVISGLPGAQGQGGEPAAIEAAEETPALAAGANAAEDPASTGTDGTPASAAPHQLPSEWDRVQRELDELMPAAARRRGQGETAARGQGETPVRGRNEIALRDQGDVAGRGRALPDLVTAAVDRTSAALAVAAPEVAQGSGETAAGSLRARVYAVLDQLVPAGDTRDNATLTGLVVEQLGMGSGSQATVRKYVRAWRADVAAGRREPAAGRRLRAVPRSS